MADFIVVAEPKSEFGLIIRELIFVDGTDEKNWEALTTAREQLGDKYHVRRAYEGWVPLTETFWPWRHVSSTKFRMDK